MDDDFEKILTLLSDEEKKSLLEYATSLLSEEGERVQSD